MKQETCPSCGKTQLWDELWGYANKLCPEFCTMKFTEILPMTIEDCWIDVDDKLPEDYQEVLFFAINHQGNKEIMTGHREHGLWMHCCWFYSSMKCDNTIAVTHWMPLPDYPTVD